MAKIYQLPISAVYREATTFSFRPASNPREQSGADPSTEPGGEDGDGAINLSKSTFNVWED